MEVKIDRSKDLVLFTKIEEESVKVVQNDGKVKKLTKTDGTWQEDLLILYPIKLEESIHWFYSVYSLELLSEQTFSTKAHSYKYKVLKINDILVEKSTGNKYKVTTIEANNIVATSPENITKEIKKEKIGNYSKEGIPDVKLRYRSNIIVQNAVSQIIVFLEGIMRAMFLGESFHDYLEAQPKGTRAEKLYQQEKAAKISINAQTELDIKKIAGIFKKMMRVGDDTIDDDKLKTLLNLNGDSLWTKEYYESCPLNYDDSPYWLLFLAYNHAGIKQRQSKIGDARFRNVLFFGDLDWFAAGYSRLKYLEFVSHKKNVDGINKKGEGQLFDLQQPDTEQEQGIKIHNTSFNVSKLYIINQEGRCYAKTDGGNMWASTMQFENKIPLLSPKITKEEIKFWSQNLKEDISMEIPEPWGHRCRFAQIEQATTTETAEKVFEKFANGNSDWLASWLPW